MTDGNDRDNIYRLLSWIQYNKEEEIFGKQEGTFGYCPQILLQKQNQRE